MTITRWRMRDPLHLPARSRTRRLQRFLNTAALKRRRVSRHRSVLLMIHDGMLGSCEICVVHLANVAHRERLPIKARLGKQLRAEMMQRVIADNSIIASSRMCFLAAQGAVSDKRLAAALRQGLWVADSSQMREVGRKGPAEHGMSSPRKSSTSSRSICILAADPKVIRLKGRPPAELIAAEMQVGVNAESSRRCACEWSRRTMRSRFRPALLPEIIPTLHLGCGNSRSGPSTVRGLSKNKTLRRSGREPIATTHARREPRAKEACQTSQRRKRLGHAKPATVETGPAKRGDGRRQGLFQRTGR